MMKRGTRAMRQQIDVRACHQLRRFDTEPRHQGMCFENAGVCGLTFVKHDLEFHEMPEVLNAVEVHAGSANEVQGAVLHDPTRLAIVRQLASA